MHTATGMRQPLDHFIRVEGSGLRRTGYLLTGSGPVADELLREVLAQLVRLGTDLADTPRCLAAARRCLVRLARSQHEAARPPAAPRPVAEDACSHLLAALAELRFEHRAAVVLAWFCRLDDAATGDALQVDHRHAALLRLEGVDQLRVALAGLGDQLVLDGREGDGRGRGPTGAGTGKGPDAPAERPVA